MKRGNCLFTLSKRVKKLHLSQKNDREESSVNNLKWISLQKNLQKSKKKKRMMIQNSWKLINIHRLPLNWWKLEPFNTSPLEKKGKQKLPKRSMVKQRLKGWVSLHQLVMQKMDRQLFEENAAKNHTTWRHRGWTWRRMAQSRIPTASSTVKSAQSRATCELARSRSDHLTNSLATRRVISHSATRSKCRF